MSDSSQSVPLARKLFWILGVCLLVLISLHFLLQFVNLEVYHQQHGQFYELSNRFDFDDEASVPTWFSQFLFFLIAVLAGLAAYLARQRVRRWLWGIISITALIGSIDEVGGLHEYALQTLHVMFYQDAGPSKDSNAWLLVLPFILVIAAGFLYVMMRNLPKRTVALFAFAVAVFLVGAIGIDVLASISERETFLNQGIFVGIEETLELLSLVITSYAIADYLERQYSQQLRRSIRALKD